MPRSFSTEELWSDEDTQVDESGPLSTPTLSPPTKEKPSGRRSFAMSDFGEPEQPVASAVPESRPTTPAETGQPLSKKYEPETTDEIIHTRPPEDMTGEGPPLKKLDRQKSWGAKLAKMAIDWSPSPLYAGLPNKLVDEVITAPQRMLADSPEDEMRGLGGIIQKSSAEMGANLLKGSDRLEEATGKFNPTSPRFWTGLTDAVGKIFGTDIGADKALTDLGEPVHAIPQAVGEKIQEGLDQNPQWTPHQVDDWKEYFTSPSKLVEHVAATAPYMAATMALYAAGGPPATALFTYVVEGEGEYDDSMKELAPKVESGEITLEEAKDQSELRAKIVGAVTAATEQGPLKLLMGDKAPGAKAMTRQAAKKVVKDWIKTKGVKKIAAAALLESAQEVAQRWSSIISAKAVSGTDATGVFDEDKDFTDKLKIAFNESMKVAVPAAAVGAGGGGVSAKVNVDTAQKVLAEADQQDKQARRTLDAIASEAEITEGDIISEPQEEVPGEAEAKAKAIPVEQEATEVTSEMGPVPVTPEQQAEQEAEPNPQPVPVSPEQRSQQELRQEMKDMGFVEPQKLYDVESTQDEQAEDVKPKSMPEVKKQLRADVTENIKDPAMRKKLNRRITTLRTEKQVMKFVEDMREMGMEDAARIEAQELKKSRTALRKDLRDLKSRADKLEPSLSEAANALLESVQVSKPTAKTQARLESAVKAVENDPNIQLPPQLNEAIKRLEKTSPADMSQEEVDSVRDAIATIVGQQEDIETHRHKEQSIKHNAIKKGAVRNMSERKRVVKGAWRGVGWLGGAQRFIGKNLRGLFKSMDMGRRAIGVGRRTQDSKAYMQTWVHEALIREPQRQNWRTRQQHDKALAETFDKHGVDRESAGKRNLQKAKVTLTDGKQWVGPRGGLWTIALMWQDTSENGGRQALQTSGINVKGVNGKTQTYLKGKLSEGDIKILLKEAAKDQATIDAIRDYVDNYLTPEYTRIYEKVFHRPPKTVPSYWQIIRNSDILVKNAAELDLNKSDISSLLAAEQWGSNIARVGSTAELDINNAGSILSNIVGHHALMDSMAIPGRRLQALFFNDAEFATEIKQAYGEAFLRDLRHRLRTVYGYHASLASGVDPLAKFMSKARNLGQKSVMFANLKMGMLQPMSLTLAADILPGVLHPKYLVPNYFTPARQKIIDDIVGNYAPLIDQRFKMGGALRETGEHRGKDMATNVLAGYQNRDKAGKVVGTADKVAINRIVLEAYEQAKREGLKGEAAKERAGWIAEEVTDLTQPTFDPASRTGLGGTKSEFVKWLTMWRSYTDKVLTYADYNMQELSRDYREAKGVIAKSRVGGKMVGKLGYIIGTTAASKVVRNYMWLAITGVLAKAIFDGDEPPEEEWEAEEKDEPVSKVLGELAESAVGLPPITDRLPDIVKSISSAVEEDYYSAFKHADRATSKDIPVLEPTMDAITSFIEGMKAKSAKSAKAKDKAMFRSIESGVNAVSKATPWTAWMESTLRNFKPLIYEKIKRAHAGEEWQSRVKSLAGTRGISYYGRELERDPDNAELKEKFEKEKKKWAEFKKIYTYEQAEEMLQKKYDEDLQKYTDGKRKTRPTKFETQWERLYRNYYYE